MHCINLKVTHLPKRVIVTESKLYGGVYILIHSLDMIKAKGKKEVWINLNSFK